MRQYYVVKDHPSKNPEGRWLSGPGTKWVEPIDVYEIPEFKELDILYKETCQDLYKVQIQLERLESIARDTIGADRALIMACDNARAVLPGGQT